MQHGILDCILKLKLDICGKPGEIHICGLVVSKEPMLIS